MPDKTKEHFSTLPLGMVPAGKTVKLVEIEGGRRLRKRLADLGLNIGLCVRVTHSDSHGPVILAVKEDTRLALGRGMAYKILVTPQDSDTD